MFKRFVYVMLLLIVANNCSAQIISAKIGINGLTCSQCSRSVEMQLRKLSFVQNVNMDLQSTVGTLQFKEGSDVDFSKVAKAVKDAGFSVRFLDAEIDMRKVEANEKGFRIGNDFYFVPDVNNIRAGNTKFRFLGRMFSSEKQGKRLKTKDVPGDGHVYNLEMVSA